MSTAIPVPAAYAPDINGAARAYRIPPAVLAGLLSVESNFGQDQGPSSAGAVGPAQFLPSTAAELGINPYNQRQAIYGAARYLTQLGAHTNLTLALERYNAGSAHPEAGAGYAQEVLDRAHSVTGLGGGANLPAAATPAATATADAAPDNQQPSEGLGHFLERLAITIGLAAGGFALTALGARGALNRRSRT